MNPDVKAGHSVDTERFGLSLRAYAELVASTVVTLHEGIHREEKKGSV